MNGNSVFIDTNIVLYLLNGDSEVAKLLQRKTIYISIISEIELLGYKGILESEKNVIQNFLNQCVIINITQAIKVKVIELKSTYAIKLPDALIAATAIIHDLHLITADKGFEKIKDLKLSLYTPKG